MDSDVRNGYDDIKVTFEIDADASKEDIEAIVAQSQKRSAVYDALTNPVNVTVEVVESIEQLTTVVVGAGHAGLAASRFLTDRSIDHVLLERGDVANSWRRERWESLRLLTPNWQSRLPGHRYDGPDPDGYMTMPEVIEFISRFADGVECAGSHQYERHVGDTHGRRVSHRDDQWRYPLPVRRHRERRLQSAERAGASSGGAGVCRADHPVRVSRRVQVARWGCARRRCVGHRSAARRGDSPLGATRDARQSGSTSACRAGTADAMCCGGWIGRGCGISRTTRSTI